MAQRWAGLCLSPSGAQTWSCPDQRPAVCLLLLWDVYNVESWQALSSFCLICPLPRRQKHFKGRDCAYKRSNRGRGGFTVVKCDNENAHVGEKMLNSRKWQSSRKRVNEKMSAVVLCLLIQSKNHNFHKILIISKNKDKWSLKVEWDLPY